MMTVGGVEFVADTIYVFNQTVSHNYNMVLVQVW